MKDMIDYEKRLLEFFGECGLEKVFVRCYGIGGHFYNVEVRTSSPITVEFIQKLFDRKFFNIRITDCLKTKMMINMEIYKDNLEKL